MRLTHPPWSHLKTWKQPWTPEDLAVAPLDCGFITSSTHQGMLRRSLAHPFIEVQAYGPGSWLQPFLASVQGPLESTDLNVTNPPPPDKRFFVAVQKESSNTPLEQIYIYEFRCMEKVKGGPV